MPDFIEVMFNLPVRKSFTYIVQEGQAAAAGFRVKAPFGGRLLTGFVTAELPGSPAGNYTVKPIDRVLDTEPLFGTYEIDLARWLSKMYFCSPGEALAAMLPGGIRKSRIEEEDFPEPDIPAPYTLSAEQTAGVRKILEEEKGMFYVYGVTGSGKTEVYLGAAEEILNSGGGVIYLVPEIALTHQILDTLQSRFGETAAILHSGLTPSQRLDEWKRIRGGKARLVVGARSAVFAPVSDLGLIIIDEEHESSYKSGFSPRYHARQVAMHRCAEAGAKLIMGSATPSVEAYSLMKSGRITGIHLSRRLAGGEMPVPVVVDMKREKSSISALLAREMAAVLNAGKQSILFLNRRGFSYFFHCRSCGYESKCRHCSVNLTFHKTKNKMICHYCGYSEDPITMCPSCGSYDVGYSGFGTEKIEEDIAKLFPDARIGRVDTDSVQKRGVLKQTLARFASGRIDILLGTQMVAKGLNFPGVDLVGIVLADTGLSLPDFRSAERTFQLIVQVSGRAGRFSKNGKVVIQTFRPENEAVQYACRMDVDGFMNRELETREALGFPPFSRLFRVVFRGKDRGKTDAFSFQFADMLAAGIGDAGEILGPAECPIAVLSGNHRFQIIIRTENFSQIHAVLARVIGLQKPPAGVYTEFDVDPVSLL